MKKRTILITGSSSGIGKALVKSFLERGDTVIGIARRKQAEENNFFSYSLDLEKLDSLEASLKRIVDKHPTIDTIICNAGKGHFGNLEEFSYPQIEELFRLNFFHAAFLSRFFIPYFKKQLGGDMLFIGSEAALRGKKRGSIYSATKFALRGFAQSLREECSTANIRVTLIEPGMCHTNFYDNLNFRPKNGLYPEDVAKIIVSILSLDRRALCEEILLSPVKKELEFVNKNG